jgi:hypothetical protein
VIGPDGKLVALYRGSDWKADDVMNNLQKPEFQLSGTKKNGYNSEQESSNSFTDPDRLANPDPGLQAQPASAGASRLLESFESIDKEMANGCRSITKISKITCRR